MGCLFRTFKVTSNKEMFLFIVNTLQYIQRIFMERHISHLKQTLRKSSHLISDASRKDGLHNNSGGLSSHDTEAEASAIVHQLDRFHVLPLGTGKEEEE